MRLVIEGREQPLNMLGDSISGRGCMKILRSGSKHVRIVKDRGKFDMRNHYTQHGRHWYGRKLVWILCICHGLKEGVS